MIIVTTPVIPGKEDKIAECFGIVSGEIVAGIHLGKDILAGFRNLVGGRSGAYEEELIKAKKQATEEMILRAKEIGANAIVGVNYDFETIGAEGSMFVVLATGTAVLIKE